MSTTVYDVRHAHDQAHYHQIRARHLTTDDIGKRMEPIKDRWEGGRKIRRVEFNTELRCVWVKLSAVPGVGWRRLDFNHTVLLESDGEELERSSQFVR